MRPQNWVKTRFESSQMNFKEPNVEADYAAAVAAAAYAITTCDLHVMDQTEPDVQPQFHLPNFLSGFVDRTIAIAKPFTTPERMSDEYETARRMMREKTIHPIQSPKRTSTLPKKRMTFTDEQHEVTDMPPFDFIEKAPSFYNGELEDINRMIPTSSFSGRNPTFGQAHNMQNAETTKQEMLPTNTFPYSSSLIPTSPEVQPKRSARYRGMRTDIESDADAWEREQMEKIKARYEKLNATILDWEDNKKKKARRKIETAESEGAKRRPKAMHNYQIEMEKIKEISDGARAQAKDRRRNEELKVMEKANKYRETGQPPLSTVCLCF
ncbi:unnamed protein product [Amaranthus hypochondriacus]